MLNLKALSVTLVKENIEKKYGSFLLGKFHHINILRFILYSTVLRNFSHIHSEVFFSTSDFFL